MSKNIEGTKRSLGDIVYFDRGILNGKDGARYQRYAVQTHFVEKNESYIALIQKYISPLYQKGDCLAFGAKVMAMCTGRVYDKSEVKPGFFANLLWRFAARNSTGIGMHQPHKLQLAINLVGLPRILFATLASAVTKPFGVKGVFYKITGSEVAGIDGFYPDSSFKVYHDLALVNPKNPEKLCDDVFAKTGIPCVIMDANDFDQNQLGKGKDSPLSDAQIQDALKDNPFGQGDELTPLILIRPV